MNQMDIDLQIDTDIEMLCSMVGEMTIDEKKSIANELFKFLFQWHPNLSINHTEDMTRVWFNAKYYVSFQHAIKQFNMQYKDYKITYKLYTNLNSYYDCGIDIYFSKRRV